MSIDLQIALESKWYTVLKDRVLFFDGDSVVTPDKVDQFITTPICVTELTEDIEKYNSLVDKSQQIHLKKSFGELNHDWNIPSEYIELNIRDTLLELLYEETTHMNQQDAEKRANRVKEELAAYEQMDMIPLLRVIFYIINTLRSHNIVWGIGRGSCVSSYVLYLLGVHDVDSVAFDLNYTEFLRTSD